MVFAASSSAFSLLAPLFRMYAPVTMRRGARRSLADMLITSPGLGFGSQEGPGVSALLWASYPGRQPHMRVPVVVREQSAGEDRPHPDEIRHDEGQERGRASDAPVPAA